MAKLIISRNREFINMLREYRIYLNNDKIGSISNGETEEFEIQEGIYDFCVRIDWCGSQKLPITLKNGEERIMKISGFRFGGLLAFFTSVAILFPILFPIFFQQFMKDNLFIKIPIIIFILLVLTVLVYFLTFGRNKYLVISEKY